MTTATGATPRATLYPISTRIRSGHPTPLTSASRFESRDERLLRSLDHALDRLEERLGADMSNWRWGSLHRVTLVGLPIGDGGTIGGEEDPLSIAGGPWSLRGCDPSLRSSDLTCSGGGPVARLVVELTPWGPFGEVVLAGGQTGDPGDDAYRGEIETWISGDARPLPFEIDDVLDAAERHIRLVPSEVGSQ